MIKLKKIIALVLITVLCFSFVACGNTSAVKTNSEFYKLGDTVSTDIFEFTLNSAEFTVALNNVNDDNRYTPKEYDANVDAKNPYVAPIGHTYTAFSYTVTNLNRASSKFHSGSFATVKYDGKKYSSLEEGAYFLYADKLIQDTNGNIRTEKAGEWYNNSVTGVLLMTGAKETRRSRIDMAVEIKDLTEDVEITFSIPNSDGTNTAFTYLVTESDRAEYTKPEIEMSLDLALISFTKKAGQEYFKNHMDEYTVVTGSEITNILTKKWTVDYIGKIGHWSGTFWFEEDGNIRDDYGYVNNRTWSIDCDTLIINGEINCEMRRVSDKVFLLISDGEPYMLMK